MQSAAEKTWSSTQQTLRDMLSPDIYNLWFAPVQAVNLDADSISLLVANDFCELWLKDNYLPLIQEILKKITARNLRVTFLVATPGMNGEASATCGPKPPPAEEPAEKQSVQRESIFNPKNTFETFVVGNNNSFAHAAALGVAQVPGKSYNPLFLYGGVGLGKTHLLHAIGQHIVAQQRAARVSYVSCEKFTNEYIDAIQNKQLFRFRKRYRQTDVLLIDDIQFLAGKEGIQEEFFHTFNALHEAHRQIVLTCDRPVGQIQNLEHRLVSRFEWGLVTDLQPPDVETRMAILRKKEKSMGVALPQEIIAFLADRIRSNVRRLEGALIRAASYASLTGKQLTVPMVETLLREVLHEEGRLVVTIDIIQKKVAEHYDIRVSDLTGKRRPENIVFPRQVAMFLSRQFTGSSLNAIGEAFGGRDHGTVLHACRLVQDRMEVDPGVRQRVSFLEKQLQR